MSNLPENPVDRVNFLRQKVLNREDVTDEELKEAISLLRVDIASNVKQSKAANSLPADLKDMF
jgi:hypothetical protein